MNLIVCFIRSRLCLLLSNGLRSKPFSITLRVIRTGSRALGPTTLFNMGSAAAHISSLILAAPQQPICVTVTERSALCYLVTDIASQCPLS